MMKMLGYWVIEAFCFFIVLFILKMREIMNFVCVCVCVQGIIYSEGEMGDARIGVTDEVWPLKS